MQRYLSTITTGFFCLLILGTVSCKKEPAENGQPPVLKEVTYLTNRANVLPSANFGEWILVKGMHLKTTHKVEINTLMVPDSLIYADDTSVTIKIPATLPDPANNPITVTTKFGSATLAFKILQPAPIFTSFSLPGGNAGETISLYGNYFDGVQSVFFGDKKAKVVFVTKTEIKVEVPADFESGKITITTPSGSVTSDKVFGFKYVLFDESLIAGWWNGPWGGTQAVSSEQARRGTNSVKYTATGTWGGAKWGKNAPDVSLVGITGFKISLYGSAGTENKKVKVILNGVSGKGYEVLLKEGKWQDFQIPLTNLGEPATLNTVTVQEFSGNKSIFYMDDIGFY